MKKLVLGLTLAASMFSLSAFADEWTGFISDSMCAAKHVGATAKDSSCAKACIKKGADAVFLSDGKVIKIAPDSMAQAKDHAGETVKINGSMNDGMVTISSIEATK
ncbi:MAG: hypothetical protein WA324_05825 [Bryobacteraceae bacterium]